MPVQITVLESLVYSARLRFSKTVSTDIVYSFVQEAGFRVLPPLPESMHIPSTAPAAQGKYVAAQPCSMVRLKGRSVLVDAEAPL